jgi:hypothetical protein
MKKTARQRVWIFLLLLVSAMYPFAIEAQEFRFLTFVDYYGGIEPAEGYENLRTRIFMQPTFSGYSDTFGFEWLLSSRLWVQPLGDPYALEASDILYESYIFFPFESFELTIGQKIVDYGFADVYGPLNIAHSSKQALLSLDEAYDNAQPDPLVQLRFYPGFDDILEVCYVPVSRRDAEQADPVFLPGSKDTIIWDDGSFILDTPHSVFFNYTHYGHNTDFQLLYAWYVEQTPDFQIEETLSTDESEITTVYNRAQSFGAAYSSRLGASTFSQDLAFKLTGDFQGTDIGAQNSSITVNTQLLTNLPGQVLGQFSLVYSYFFNHNDYDKGADPTTADYLASQINTFHAQPYEHIAFMVGHFERAFLRERLKTQLNVGYFFSPELYFAPRLTYSITDFWTLEGGADITLGDPPDDDLRRNPTNDNFYVRLLYRY